MICEDVLLASPSPWPLFPHFPPRQRRQLICLCSEPKALRNFSAHSSASLSAPKRNTERNPLPPTATLVLAASAPPAFTPCPELLFSSQLPSPPSNAQAKLVHTQLHPAQGSASSTQTAPSTAIDFPLRTLTPAASSLLTFGSSEPFCVKSHAGRSTAMVPRQRERTRPACRNIVVPGAPTSSFSGERGAIGAPQAPSALLRADGSTGASRSCPAAGAHRWYHPPHPAPATRVPDTTDSPGHGLRGTGRTRVDSRRD